MTKPMNVALIGRAGAGKTTVAKALVDLHGYFRVSWADGVRAVFEMAYGPLGEPGSEEYAERKRGVVSVNPHKGMAGQVGTAGTLSIRSMLQRIGDEALRQHVDLDFWIKAGLRRVESLREQGVGLFVNDDTRYVNEVSALADAKDWLIVRLQASREERMARLGLTDEGLTHMERHPSETGIDALSYHVLVESGDNRSPESIAAFIVREALARAEWRAEV